MIWFIIFYLCGIHPAYYLFRRHVKRYFGSFNSEDQAMGLCISTGSWLVVLYCALVFSLTKSNKNINK